MAVIETWLRQDLVSLVSVQNLSGHIFTQDNQGNRIGVEVTKNGVPVELSGTCTGYVIRSDGKTVVMYGEIDGNKASILLPAACYAVVGNVNIVLKVGETTLLACTGYVYRTTTDTIVDPGTVVPNITELLDKIDEMEQGTAAAVAAAEAIEDMTVEAEDGGAVDAVITDVDGHKHIAFTIPSANSKAPAILKNVSGDIVTFDDGSDGVPLKECVVSIDPVQDTSGGDPSPSHVCSISGHTGTNVCRTGRNLASVTSATIKRGTIILYDTPLPAGGYSISFSATRDGESTTNASLRFMYNDGTYGNISFPVNTGVRYESNSLVFAKPVSSVYAYSITNSYSDSGNYTLTLEDIQLELGTTVHDFEPYTGQTYPVDWEDTAGTVYGGTLDTVTGVLTVTRAYFDASAWTWNQDGTSRRFRVRLTSYNETPYNKILSNVFAPINPNVALADRPDYSITMVKNNYYQLEVAMPSTYDLTAFNSFLADVDGAGTHAVIVLMYNTPVTYQLDPVRITTLSGYNAIWADTGAIQSLTYPADTKTYIDESVANVERAGNEQIAPVEDTTTATRDYQAGDLFILDDILYKATALIVTGDTIYPGINAVETTVEDLIDEVVADIDGIIDDTAGDGDTDKTWSADKLSNVVNTVSETSDDVFNIEGSLYREISNPATWVVGNWDIHNGGAGTNSKRIRTTSTSYLDFDYYIKSEDGVMFIPLFYNGSTFVPLSDNPFFRSLLIRDYAPEGADRFRLVVKTDPEMVLTDLVDQTAAKIHFYKSNFLWKADKVNGAVGGHLAQLDEHGNLEDSGFDSNAFDEKAPAIFREASGDIVAFSDAAGGMPLKSCSVDINFIQDLHGEAYPFPAEASANMIPNGTNTSNGYVSGKYIAKDGVAKNSSGNYISEWFDVLPDTQYVYSAKTSQTIAAICFFDSGKNYISGVNFSEDGTATLIAVTTPSNAAYARATQAYANTDLLQFEPGTSGTEIKPYSNICPITGFNACNIFRTGQNIYDYIAGATGSNYYTLSDGIVTIDRAYGTGGVTMYGFHLYGLMGKTVTVSADVKQSKDSDDDRNTVRIGFKSGSAAGAYGHWYEATLNAYDTWERISCTLTLETYNEWKLGIQPRMAGHTLQFKNVQVEFGSVAHDYVPYTGQAYTVDWQTSAGTVYKGTVDPVSGELTVTMAGMIIDGIEKQASGLEYVSETSDWTYIRGKYTVLLADLPNDIPYNNGTQKCSHFLWRNYSGRKATYPDQICFAGSNRNVRWISSTYTTLEEFNQYLIDQNTAGTPVTLVYPLPNPVTYQLDPVQINMLLGCNAIWSDTTGTTAVVYPADTKAYIDEVTDPDGNVVSVTGSTPSITGESGKMYVCGMVDSINITPPQTGIIDVVFTSGTTPAVLTASGVSWPGWFNPNSLDASTTYEINIMNGLGGVMSWPI